MNIKHTCQHCFNTLEIPERFAGQTGRCAKCGATITLPPLLKPVPRWKLGVLWGAIAVFGSAVVIGAFTDTPKPEPLPEPVAIAAEVVQPQPEPVPATLLDLVREEIGESNRDDAPRLVVVEDDTARAVQVRFAMSMNFTTKMEILGAQMDTIGALKVIQSARPGYAATITVTASMVDRYGNSEEMDVVRMFYAPATLQKINFAGMRNENIWRVADDAYIHPGLK